MNVQLSRWRRPVVAVAAIGTTLTACLIAVLVIDQLLAEAGRDDLRQLATPVGLFFLVPIISAFIAGSALAVRRSRHPVGWLFLLLALSIVGAGLVDGYAAYGAVARPGALPGAEVMAVIGVSAYIPWLVLLSLILLTTPDGRLHGLRARAAALGLVIGGMVAVAAGVVRPYNGDNPAFAEIDNPLALTTGAGLLTVLRWAGIIVIHVGLLASVGATLLRFRRARARERDQLRWLGMASIPFLLFVLGAFAGAVLDNELLLTAATAGVLAIIPLVVALSIERHSLYDIDRLVTRAVTWVVLSFALIGTYVMVVVVIGQSIGQAWDSAVPVAAATLATASIVGPLRHRIQDGLDRRFNRRRFETLALLRAFARDPAPEMTVEEALRMATGDPSLAVAYRIDERDTWVSEDGSPSAPAADGVPVPGRSGTICVIGHDKATVDRPTVEAAADEARSELENARLRAAIAVQLVEVRQSRARIVEAQLAERRRIERDLHDGAQQRLLGLAMQLSAAEVSGDHDRILAMTRRAIGEVKAAVRDLRELANGLRPSVLTDSGLAAALEDLAARTPVPIHLATTRERFTPAVEETAWFIACEAVANAVKHAAPCSVTIRTCCSDDHLRLVIEDDGVGGADPNGGGLRGLADRAEAAGGVLTVRPRGGRGTVLTAELPVSCGS